VRFEENIARLNFSLQDAATFTPPPAARFSPFAAPFQSAPPAATPAAAMAPVS
jgi:hypothetical protein